MLTRRTCLGTVAMMGGVPAVLTEFCWSWGQMTQYNAEHLCGPNEYIHLDRANQSFHAAARNELVERMRGDWLFMLDTDHQFEPDLLCRLLRLMNTHDVDVLSGLYTHRQHPHPPVLWMKDQEFGYSGVSSWRLKDNHRIVRVDACGGGCLLVRRRLFDTIRHYLKEEPFSVEPPYSEDRSFCRRLEKLGIPLWFAPEVECHHLQVRALSYADMDTEVAVPTKEHPSLGV